MNDFLPFIDDLLCEFYLDDVVPLHEVQPSCWNTVTSSSGSTPRVDASRGVAVMAATWSRMCILRDALLDAGKRPLTTKSSDVLNGCRL